MALQWISTFGLVPGLWGLVNNAGVAGKRGRIEWLSIDDYKDVNAINLYGLIDTTMVFLPLIKRERGRIVSVTSVGGRISAPELTPYCISKYGVEAFNDSLRSVQRHTCYYSNNTSDRWPSLPRSAIDDSEHPSHDTDLN